jgi:flagellar hook-length control protein FliK
VTHLDLIPPAPPPPRHKVERRPPPEPTPAPEPQRFERDLTKASNEARTSPSEPKARDAAASAVAEEEPAASSVESEGDTDASAQTTPDDSTPTANQTDDVADEAAADGDEPVVQINLLIGDDSAAAVSLDELDLGEDGTWSQTFTLPDWLSPSDGGAALLTVSLNAGPSLESATGALNGAANPNAATTPGLPLTPANPATTTAAPLPNAELLAATASDGAAAQGNSTGGDGEASNNPGNNPSSNAPASAVNRNATPNANAATASAFSAAAEPANAPTTPAANPAGPGAPGNAAPTTPTTASANAAAAQASASASTSGGGDDTLNAARLSRGLNSVLNQQGGNVTLRLTPPEMGTVRIQLSLQGTTVSALFHAETEAGRKLLNQQLTQLRQSLEGQGLSVDRLGVQALSSSSSSSNLQQQTSQDPSGQQQATDPDGRGQQQPGNNGSGDRTAEEDRALDNLATARDLFSELLDEDEPGPEAA